MQCQRCSGLLLLRGREPTFTEYLCLTCGRERIVNVSEREIAKRKKASRRRKVQQMVQEYGVNITADILGMPRSTVGLWTKGMSDKPKWGFNRGKYSREFKTEVAEYAIRAKNYYYSAKKFKIARGSIQNWVKEYKQHGGKGWLSKNHMK